jgi:hypothetical protein
LLFVWLIGQYRYTEARNRSGAASPSWEATQWKVYILRCLKERGTRRACQAIRRVMVQLPELAAPRFELQEAEAIARRNTWRPPLPRELFRIASDPRSRLVESGAALLDVLMDSLRRLQVKLQDENPLANFLWDRQGKKRVYRPREENDLSDFITRHLKDDIRPLDIVVNREVQIRRREETDIHVDALAPGGRDRISAIIELKGCWHDELLTAMETQLASFCRKTHENG